MFGGERMLERERLGMWAGCWTLGDASGLLAGLTDMLLRERSWRKVETGKLGMVNVTFYCD